jgi:apolipoprotein N-acyltransferase
MRNDRITVFLEDFLWAGSSAFMMSLSHVAPEMWPLSLFALVPFLWRVSHATLTSAVRLGVLLAISYAFVSVPLGNLSAITVFVHVSLMCALFAAFAVVINRMARRIGPNAVFMAVLWLPVEYVLHNVGPLGGIFSPAHIDSVALTRLGSLLGTLMVSFLFVLVNAIVLGVIARVVHAQPPRMTAPANMATRGAVVAVSHICHTVFYHLPQRRGPPVNLNEQ